MTMRAESELSASDDRQPAALEGGGQLPTGHARVGRARVLVLFAHPAIHRSRVNRRLAHSARTTERVTFHDLYEAYPDLDVDVDREQALLVEHDVVVMQHPFYWYSTPAILKQWQDLVLEHGWAYGREGKALHGKVMMNALTAGGGKEAYRRDGYNHFRMRELLAPFEQTARLCGMSYLPPFAIHGTHRLTSEQIETAARDYGRLLSALSDGTVDWSGLRDSNVERINDDLERWLRPPLQNAPAHERVELSVEAP